jgi:hypothetical protein
VDQLEGMLANANDADVLELVKKLSNIEHAASVTFNSLDDIGARVDCINIFQPQGSDRLYGVYHEDLNGYFNLHLAMTDNIGNLSTWTHVVELEDHASQGKMHVHSDGSFILAYEVTIDDGNSLKLHYYPTLAHLVAAAPTAIHQMPRSLALKAEGTPSFESVQINGSLANSVIKLRFHFWEDRIRD